MYLHYILSLEDDQLLSRVFAVQCENPVPNDWCLKVKQDLIDFEINYNFEDIKHMKKETASGYSYVNFTFISAVRINCRLLTFLSFKK